jgi:hypothetical protein
MEMPLTELYWFDDGLMIRGDIFYKDTKGVLALHEEPARTGGTS